MKKIWFISLTVLILSGCYSSNRMIVAGDENLINIDKEEEAYEIQVLDPGFETWFATTWSRAMDRDVSYYSYWNQRYVTEWNYKASRPHTSSFFDNQIAYDPSVDYGIEVERKLYYYFRWVDTKLGIPILSVRPPGMV